MKEELKQSFPWLNSLLSYFKRVKDLDDEIEVIRVLICESSQFSPLSLFSYLDCSNKCFLTLNDFKSFLRSQKSSFDERRLRKMIHNFDKDNDFSINLDEFLGLILPRKNSVLKSSMCCMVYTCCYNNCVSPEIISHFNDLLLREMNLVKELDQIALETKNSINFSTYEVFRAIVEDDKYMTKFNLNNFLTKNNVSINEEEVAQLMFRLDSDNDDRISYEEFKEMFFPVKEDFFYIPKKDIKVSDFNSNIKESYQYNSYDNYLNDNKSYKDSDYNKNDYSNNNYSKNDYSKNDYSKNDYSNNNYSKNDYNNNYIKNDYNNNDNYSKNDNDNDSEKSSGKNGKKTKKVVLRPGGKANSSSSTANLFHSKKPIDNFPSDNYTLNRSTKFKCNECSRNKKAYNDDDYDNKNNKYSTINQYDTIPDENTDINKNYNERNISSFRQQNNRFYSSLLNEGNDDNDNHKYNKGKCKACMMTSKNMYNDDFRSKNYDSLSSPGNSNSRNNYYNNNSNINYNTLFMDRNTNDNMNFRSSRNEPRRDIYKGKDELIKKYLYYDNNECNEIWDNNDFCNKNDDNKGNRDRERNSRSKYSFREEKISTSINKSCCSPKINNLDNDSDDNKNYSSITREDNQNRNKRPTFAERFKKIRENKDI